MHRRAFRSVAPIAEEKDPNATVTHPQFPDEKATESLLDLVRNGERRLGKLRKTAGPGRHESSGIGLDDRSRRVGSMRVSLRLWLVAAVTVSVAACGGDPAADNTGGEQSTTASVVETSTTTSTEATTTEATTTTTTTTTLPAIDVEVVNAAFRSYFDLIAAADYAGARELATGSAGLYASFTEHLDLISPQPDWKFESGPEAAGGEAVALSDGRFGSEASLVYVDGDSRLAVSNPVVSLVETVPLLDEWGVDLGSGIDQPLLSKRLKLIGFAPTIDSSSCFDTGMWAYVPGGSDTSETVRIIAIGLACSPNGDLTPQIENTRLYSSDGEVDVAPVTFLLQGGGQSAPMGTPTLYLAIFDISADAASADLTWETPFDRSNVPATSFHAWPIGPFDLG